MTVEALLGRLFVQLEGNDEIGLEVTREIAHHHDGVVAVGTFGCGHMFVTDDLTAARLADVYPHAVRLALAPFTARVALPVEIVLIDVAELFIVGLERFHVKLVVTIRTFHFLQFTVKFDRAAARGAFVLQ